MEKVNRELPSSKDMDKLSQETGYVIGQDNIQIYGLDVHNPVFAMSAALVLIFSSLALAFPETSTSILVSLKTLSLTYSIHCSRCQLLPHLFYFVFNHFSFWAYSNWW